MVFLQAVVFSLFNRSRQTSARGPDYDPEQGDIEKPEDDIRSRRSNDNSDRFEDLDREDDVPRSDDDDMNEIIRQVDMGQPPLEDNEDGYDDDETTAPRNSKIRLRRFASVSSSIVSTISSTPSPHTWWLRFKEFLHPKDKDDIDDFIPNYRHTPIISGICIPFSILLEIPGLTEQWYVRTDKNQTVETRKNPVILDVGMALSMACAIAANWFIIMRFLEKRVKTMTIACICFLTAHGEFSSKLFSLCGK
jgi:potassium channel subfamily K